MRVGKIITICAAGLAVLLTAAGCVQPAPQSDYWRPATGATVIPGESNLLPGVEATFPPTRVPGSPILTPTADAPHPIPTVRSEEEEYLIQSGDTLGKVAAAYGVSLDEIIAANEITNPNIVEVGQSILIPAPEPQESGSDFKIIPDSEVVYNPTTIVFDVFSFIKDSGGYLVGYREQVDNSLYTGAEIVLRVAREYSVNPRLLLAVLEYQSQWLTKSTPDEASQNYPLGFYDTNRKGLYLQLSWAANLLNQGYYQWKVNAVSSWLLSDGSTVPPAATINAGTAAVQNLMGWLYTRDGWNQAIGPDGIYKTYNTLFGYPFDYAYEPALPVDLSQPVLRLPVPDGATWSFTGGPHGGWGSGSAWAAIDFAPPDADSDCNVSPEYAVAVADGVIVRAENGVVVLDLDGDGYEQTGWTILYLHMAAQDRVATGTVVKAGDPIGHPSCEGGVANGTHVHLARRYNGEWIAADGAIPFNLDGWISSGSGVEYEGTLTRDGITVEAWDHLVPQNQISH